MKYLITGGLGFIGSHLTEFLLQQGHNVVVLDNKKKGKLKNLENVINNKNLKIVLGNTENKELTLEISKKCDAIYHFSDESDIQYCFDHPDCYFRSNIQSLQSILEASKINNIKKIIFPSSTTVFGKRNKDPVSENFGPLMPESLYGASKAACENFLYAWKEANDISINIFRFAAVIGGRQDHGVVHDFVKKISDRNKILNVLGNGEQERSFLLVDDVVRVIYEYSNKINKKFDLVHLGNSDTIKIKEVAKIVASLFNLDVKNILFDNQNELGWIGDSKTNFLDISKLQNLDIKITYNSKQAVEEAAIRLKKQYQ
jgi:UDP-glucose 4-epimerase